MNNIDERHAFGAPGTEPRWTSGAKEGVGTAYSGSANVWFTLSHGIVNELYFPHVDMPNIRDLQFLITDGGTFCHEEKRDLIHETEYPEKHALLYRLTNTEPDGRYRLVKEMIVEPHSPVFLMRVRTGFSASLGGFCGCQRWLDGLDGEPSDGLDFLSP